jgi:hypothetical protein
MLRALRIERARHVEAVIPTGTILSPEAAALLSRGPFADPAAALQAGSRGEQFVMRPVRVGRTEQVVERLNLAVKSFAAPNLREFLLAFPETSAQRVDAAGNEIGEEGEHSYTRGVVMAIQQTGRGHYVCMGRRRVAQLALAVKLYHAERGEWPATLAAIVPRYLAAIPLDPLATGGETLAYVSDERRRRVYSVGEDGIDDGGWPCELFAIRPEDLRMTDLVIHLVPQPVPTTAPTTLTASSPVFGPRD